MKTHYLKIWPSQFNAVDAGTKRHEWRQNDRDFAVGDTIVLQEYAPSTQPMRHYTGREITVNVLFMNTDFGVPAGWCVMSIGNVLKREWVCPDCGDNEVVIDDGEAACKDNRHTLLMASQVTSPQNWFTDEERAK